MKKIMCQKRRYSSFVFLTLFFIGNPTLEVIKGFINEDGGQKVRESLSVLISCFERQEKSIKVLFIKASCSKESFDGRKTKREGECHLTCLREVRPKGLIRVHENPDISRHESGKFIYANIKSFFDGEITFHNILEQGTEGKEIYRLNDGLLTVGRLGFFDLSSRYLGWDSTVLGFFEEKGLTFSQFLRNGRFSLDVKELKDRLILSWEKSSGTMRWVFNKKWGNALQLFEHREHGKLRRLDKCSSFTWLSQKNKIAYPKTIEKRFYKKDGVSFNSWSISVSSVEDRTGLASNTNDFSFQFIPGQIIQDNIHHRRFQVGQGESELQKILQKQKEKVQYLLSKEGQNVRSGGRRGVFWGALALLGFLFFVFWKKASRKRVLVQRQNRKQTSTSLFFLLFLLSPLHFLTKDQLPKTKKIFQNLKSTSISPRQSSNPLPSRNRNAGTGTDDFYMGSGFKQKVFNCGVNVGAFVLMQHNIPYSLTSLGQSLHAGVYWEKQISLKALGELFLEKGLFVRGFGGLSYAEVYKGLRKNSEVCFVIHAVSRGVGHFYLAVGASPKKGILFVNPSIRELWIHQKDQRWESFFRKWTGFGLLVRKRKIAPVVLDASSLDEKEIYLGIIEGGGFSSKSEPVVKRRFKIRNASPFEMFFRKGKGSCPCLRRIKLLSGRSLPGRSVGWLELSLDAKKLGVGHNFMRFEIDRYSSLWKKPKPLIIRGSYFFNPKGKPLKVIPKYPLGSSKKKKKIQIW